MLDFIFDMTIMVPASLIEGAFICPNKAEPGGTKLVWSISLTKQELCKNYNHCLRSK